MTSLFGWDNFLFHTLEYLDAIQLTRISGVSKQWLYVSKSRSLWRKLFLHRWPSQCLLYQNVGINDLNWQLAYKELFQKSKSSFSTFESYFQMKYFVQCSTIYHEPICAALRETMFQFMERISLKWTQVLEDDPAIYDLDEDDFRQVYDHNLYFDPRQSSWAFLDDSTETLGDDLWSGRLIDPHKVIPSCLFFYRWLQLFKIFTESPSYESIMIWLVRLKHIESGMIFEACDYSGKLHFFSYEEGCPKDVRFKEDVIELLTVLTHPLFIMHPQGLEKQCLSETVAALVSAAAGGTANLLETNCLENTVHPSCSFKNGYKFNCEHIFTDVCSDKQRKLQNGIANDWFPLFPRISMYRPSKRVLYHHTVNDWCIHPFYKGKDFTHAQVEPIPSCFVLYKLICLFDLDGQRYKCYDIDDDNTCVWNVNIIYKETRGIMHLADRNGWFEVYLSFNETNSRNDNCEKEFHEAAKKFLKFLMSENIEHPERGVIAGTCG